MKRTGLSALLGTCLLWCAACDGGSACTPGQTSQCACPGGQLGVQTCLADSTYGSCQCGAGGDGGTPQADQGVSPPGAPQFLSFGTSATRITQGQSVTFTAVLTDPDGIEDLIGGSLKSADGQRDFGAFATAAQEGAYSFKLSWTDLDDALDLTFTGEKSYTFVAEFFDAGGKRSSRSATLRAYCDLGAACSGTCVDLKTDKAHCGSCSNACKEPQNSMVNGCQAGRCEYWSACLATPASCQAACAKEGGVCDSGTAKVQRFTERSCQGTTTWDPTPCANSYSTADGWPAASIKCTCKDPP